MAPVNPISRSEFEARAEKLLYEADSRGLSGVVLFDSVYVLYFTGFAFIPTERPIAFIMNSHGDKAMFVPRLEAEHARSKTGLERIEHYAEYPSDPHPVNVLKHVLLDMGITGNLGADTDGYPWIFGYRGAALSETTGSRVIGIAAVVEDLMAIKSAAEIALIEQSALWGNLAHVLLQRYTAVGATETEVSTRATNEATGAMVDALGHLYQAQSMQGARASAGYRGQIGRNAAIPHALANNTVFQEGDVLVTGAGAPMWGYHSELERSMIIGAPSNEQRRMFDCMVGAQDTALAGIRPGARCADVDRAVRAYYEAHDLMPYWKHHTGHAIGLRYHEGPFLDVGDNTEIRPGMVFTVEPGLYASGLGGFRHSDTVCVTDNGIEMITYYPRTLQSLTIPA